MDIRMRIGKRIKELRLGLGLTQEALADKVDLDKTYINEVENGKRNVSDVNLEKIILGLEENFGSFFHKENFV